MPGLQCFLYDAPPEGMLQLNCFYETKDGRKLTYQYQVLLLEADQAIKAIGRSAWIYQRAHIIHEAFLKAGADLWMVGDR